jgi:hypothetical protein
MGIPRSGNLRAIGIGAAIAVGASLGILAPPAMAAPANDNFANRASLGDHLPVAVTESNVGATRETGEEVGMFATGRSIWWEWESRATQWTTVSTCQSPFQTVVGVFEGTELAHLTRVAEGNAAEGPSCPYQGNTFTFRAQAGHSYVIGADGNGFYLPAGPGEPQHESPSGEGQITLTIESTPPPPNDDFAAATPIEPPGYEESSGRRFYQTQLYGSLWGATLEKGEPQIGSGATGSVWYAWTAPGSGEVAISTCCSTTHQLEPPGRRQRSRVRRNHPCGHPVLRARLAAVSPQAPLATNSGCAGERVNGLMVDGPKSPDIEGFSAHQHGGR